MKAVWAARGVGFGKAALFWAEQGRAYFAHDLVFGTVVFIKVWFWRITAGTGAGVVYVAFGTASDRFHCYRTAIGCMGCIPGSPKARSG